MMFFCFRDFYWNTEQIAAEAVAAATATTNENDNNNINNGQ